MSTSKEAGPSWVCTAVSKERVFIDAELPGRDPHSFRALLGPLEAPAARSAVSSKKLPSPPVGPCADFPLLPGSFLVSTFAFAVPLPEIHPSPSPPIPALPLPLGPQEVPALPGSPLCPGMSSLSLF